MVLGVPSSQASEEGCGDHPGRESIETCDRQSKFMTICSVLWSLAERLLLSELSPDSGLLANRAPWAGLLRLISDDRGNSLFVDGRSFNWRKTSGAGYATYFLPIQVSIRYNEARDRPRSLYPIGPGLFFVLE